MLIFIKAAGRFAAPNRWAGEGGGAPRRWVGADGCSADAERAAEAATPETKISDGASMASYGR